MSWLKQCTTALQRTNRRDNLLLASIMLVVLNTLPVSTKGDENIINYFFAERDVKTIESVKFCLSEHTPCEVELNDGNRLKVTMPAQVSIADPFDIYANVSGPGIERINVQFVGVDHSHGLLSQAMNEVSDGHYHATGLLSYCGLKKMDWRAQVTVYTERVIYETWFSFESVDQQLLAQVE